MADPAWGTLTTGSTASFSATGGTGCRGLVILAMNQGQNITGISVTPSGGSARSATAFADSPTGKATGEGMNVAAFFIDGDEGELEGSNAIAVQGSLSEAPNCIVLPVIADGAVEINSSDSFTSDSVANPSGTLGLNGRVSVVAMVFASGVNTVGGVSPLAANWTGVGGVDFGSQVAAAATYDLVGSSDVTWGWTQVAEDAIALPVSVAKVEAAGGTFNASWASGSNVVL